MWLPRVYSLGFFVVQNSLCYQHTQDVITIKGISEAFKYTREFVLEAISYHTISKGSIIEYDEFKIDFSNVPIEYHDINELDSFEISITDTNEKRIASRNKQNKKN